MSHYDDLKQLLQEINATLAWKQLLSWRRDKTELEEVEAVSEWVLKDLRAGPPHGWETTFTETLAKGSQVYNDFMSEFTRVFYEEIPNTGVTLGWRLIQKARSRLFTDTTMPPTEMTLDVILDKRLHLLNRFQEKYQPSLFSKYLIVREIIEGYFYWVAYVETRKIPPSHRMPQISESGNLLSGKSQDPSEAMDDEPVPAGARQPRTERLAELVDGFWSQNKPFRSEERQEGLTSVGLIQRLGSPELTNAWDQAFAAFIPGLEEDMQSLRQKVSGLLAKKERWEYRLTNLPPGPGRLECEVKLNKIVQQLENRWRELKELQQKLLWKPGQAHALLAKVISSEINWQQARQRRIEKEKKILRNRVDNGLSQGLVDTVDFPQNVKQVLSALKAELNCGDSLPSPGKHDISEEERERRRKLADDWMEGVRELLNTLRQICQAVPDPLQQYAASLALPKFCKDVDYHLRYGKSGSGIVKALAELSFSELQWLLRLA